MPFWVLQTVIFDLPGEILSVSGFFFGTLGDPSGKLIVLPGMATPEVPKSRFWGSGHDNMAVSAPPYFR